ncbi:hypothetical protein CACET_c04580 [Clostridium aceticum]|uniref:Phosphatidylglycerol lysyltransferase n=1 Tax=Clostridium aceticum TaxID=84022 RepID=A0A0G3W986_9CLOT|nr:hypothetical protein CACET_c04580 [Clostridium aceticum]
MCIILWQADFSQVFIVLKDFSLENLLFICLLQLITILLINLQWHKIALNMGEKTALKDLIHMNMVGTFVESITPSAKAGGEATKVYLLKTRMGFSTGKAAALVAVQKTISLIAFLLLNILSMGWFVVSVDVEGLQVKVIFGSFLFLTVVLLVLLLLVLYPSKLLSFIKGLTIKKKWKEKFYDVLETLEATVRDMLQQKKQLCGQFSLSLIIWLLFAFKAYLIAKGLNIQLSFIGIAVITYLTYMIGMLPLLPGGVGTFEGSMVFFLLPLGVASYEGMALALILRLVTFWLVFLLSALFLGYQQLMKIQNLYSH